MSNIKENPTRYNRADNALPEIRAGEIWAESTKDFDPMKARIPADFEIERFVIGSALVTGARSWWERVIGALGNVRFQDPACREISFQINNLIAEGLDLSKLRLIEQLRKAGTFEAIGGEAVIEELIDTGVFDPVVDYEIEILKDKDRRREMLIAAQALIAQITSEADEFDDLEKYTERYLSQIERVRLNVSRNAGRTIGEAVTGLREYLRLRNDPNKPQRMGIGIPSFDRLVGGIEPGFFYLVGARPGEGKTDIALHASDSIASRWPERKVILFSPEMTYEEIALRVLARRANYNSALVRRMRELDDVEVVGLAVAELESIQNLIVYCDLEEITVASVKGAVAIHKPNVVVVDHLQEMFSVASQDQTHQIAHQMAKALKNIAKNPRWPVAMIGTSQMSREGEKQSRGTQYPFEPKLSDLLYAGEKPADVVFFNYNPFPDYDDNQEYYWIIRKNRRGPLGRVGVRWLRGVSAFEELSPAEQTYENERRERAASRRESRGRRANPNANRVVRAEESTQQEAQAETPTMFGDQQQ